MIKAYLLALCVWIKTKAWPRFSDAAWALASAWSAGILAHPVSHLITATVAAMLTLLLRWMPW